MVFGSLRRSAILRVIGFALPPLVLIAGTFVRASETTRALILLAFVLSGALIGRWWAPVASVAAWAVLALAEEANHWGFGPGTRFGTAIEIHSGGDFSFSFFALTIALAIVLPTAGLSVRFIASSLMRRIRSTRWAAPPGV